MKKLSIIFLSLLTIVTITGCGSTEEKEESKDQERKEQELVCTNTENEDGLNIEEVISMTYKNDKLKRMTMEVNTKITDSTIQENWQEFKAAMDEDNQEYSKEGIDFKVDVNDQNYEYKTILDIDIEKASEEDLEAEDFGNLKDDNSTLEEEKKSAEEDGYICEIR